MKKLMKKLHLKTLSLCALVSAFAYSFNITFASSRIQKLSVEKMKPLADMINLYAKYFSVFITILALMAFTYNIVRIGTASTNSAKRQEAIRGAIVAGSVAALVPFAGVIVFVLQNI